MKALKFNLSGKFAAFRKPEVNSPAYLTYTSIHKVALIGLIGAIIGMQGYNQSPKGELPEFYKELIDLEVSICAPKKNPTIDIVTFNNSTGLASQEDGGNLIVFENIIVNPCWTIYIKEGHKHFNKICDYILAQKVKFIPFLGRNDYFANISDMEIVEISECDTEKIQYKSLVVGDFNELEPGDLSDFHCIEKPYASVEFLPVKLNEKTRHYCLKSFLNITDKIKNKGNTFSHNDKYLYFF